MYPTSAKTLLDIPQDVLGQVTSYLSIADQKSTRLACKTLQKAVAITNENFNRCALSTLKGYQCFIRLTQESLNHEAFSEQSNQFATILELLNHSSQHSYPLSENLITRTLVDIMESLEPNELVHIWSDLKEEKSKRECELSDYEPKLKRATGLFPEIEKRIEENRAYIMALTTIKHAYTETPFLSQETSPSKTSNDERFIKSEKCLAKGLRLFVRTLLQSLNKEAFPEESSKLTNILKLSAPSNRGVSSINKQALYCITEVLVSIESINENEIIQICTALQQEHDLSAKKGTVLFGEIVRSAKSNSNLDDLIKKEGQNGYAYLMAYHRIRESYERLPGLRGVAQRSSRGK